VTELLNGLGFARVTWWSRAWLLLIIGLATVSFLLAAHGAAVVLGVPVLWIHGLLWVVWLVWLGVVFPRSREAWLRGFGPSAFRPAFYLEILPGIGCSFAQIARPGFEGLMDGPQLRPAGVVIGGLVAVLGLTLVGLGVRRLGIAGTLFVREYAMLPPLLERDGIFRELRHPLFVGGSVLALGSALMVGSGLGLVLATVNLLVIPAYVRLEDARCGQVFGREYDVYCERVGGAVPRVRASERIRRRIARAGA
jgi:protein-S-isoprenylcysteine O-methyltransferase Ste14